MTHPTTTKSSMFDMVGRDKARPTNLSKKTRMIVTVSAFLLYLLAFPLVVRELGPAGSALVIIPVSAAARLWGLRVGVLAGVVSAPLNILLFAAIGDPITFRGGISGAVTVVILGAVVGWLSELLERNYAQAQELVAARDQALEANRLKSVMLSRVSHELRTPLGAILGYAELLAEGTYGPVNELQCAKLGEIMDSAYELEVLVSDLLDMGRIESGRLQLFPKPFALSVLLEGVIGQTAVIAQEKNLPITLTVQPDMPNTLVGDPVRIAQILTNLVTNAIKYTDEGQIAITISPTSDKRWVMNVTDTGIGIAPEAQPYVFEPFRQVHVDDSYARSGIGLGLSIVHELTTLMNGSITISSRVGAGSSFAVTLPLDSQQEEI